MLRIWKQKYVCGDEKDRYRDKSRAGEKMKIVLPAKRGAETAKAEAPRGSVSRKAARSSDEKSKIPARNIIVYVIKHNEFEHKMNRFEE